MDNISSQIKKRPWWYIGLIRTNDDPPLKFIVHWICVGLIAYGIFTAFTTYSSFNGWTPPKYNELIAVDGVLERKSAGKSFIIAVTDMRTGITYSSLGYPQCQDDFGKQVHILGHKKTIYEIYVNNVLRRSYSEYVLKSAYFLPYGIKIAATGVVLYITYFIYSLIQRGKSLRFNP